MGGDDLVHEGIRLQPKPEHRDAQGHLAVDGEVILAQSVLDGSQASGVLRSIDLDVQTNVGPQHVEVDPTAGATTHRLSGRLG